MGTLKEWEQQEQEQLRKETAYLDKFNAFERMLDGHLSYCIMMLVLMPVSMGIGLLIGLLIWKP